MRKRWTIIAALLVAGCSGNGDSEVAVGTLERDRLELTAEAREPIVAIEVREGDHVTADQVLLRLDSSSFAASLQSARANVSEARHRLTELIRGPRVEEILEARAGLEGAVSRVETETSEYERVKELVARRVVSQSELDRQRAARDNAEAARKQAQAQLTLLLKGTRIEELDRAREELAQAQAAQQQVEISASRLTVRAPRAGTIEALPYELGERPPAGAAVVVMLADGETYARIYVPAALRARAVAGARAEIRIDGVEQPYAARVRYVASEAAFTPYYALTQEDRGRLSYLAEVVFTEQRAAKLPVGIPVEVTFAPANEAAQR